MNDITLIATKRRKGYYGLAEEMVENGWLFFVLIGGVVNVKKSFHIFIDEYH